MAFDSLYVLVLLMYSLLKIILFEALLNIKCGSTSLGYSNLVFDFSLILFYRFIFN